ncbi:major facilitator superfamily MFS1 [Paenibacillus sp. NAIST15-1]|nr:major facilitator superfamily MFS1 [Paenibacillus sp. NAIST15-1]
MLIVLQGLHSITYACFWALAIEFVVQLLPQKLAATGQSLLGMVFFGLSGLAGGVIGGALQESYGGNVMYSIGFVLALLGTFGFMLWNRKDRKRTLAVEQEATV